ncbi:hypothetical protein [Nostoc sp.]|uniref:hypothetical protein n=1 Tax=Nostoc sp. TaxID=1180 RepID=UPI002FFB21E5
MPTFDDSLTPVTHGGNPQTLWCDRLERIHVASLRVAMPAQRVADKPLVRVSVSKGEEKGLRCAIALGRRQC